ncbi:hypothetical protein SKC41_28175 [Mycobacterium sp. 050128]|uniref:hypothetical protein n=1 Tax=Mycobacterium sp. 050128 TaxID=3096112 RepID=UPI002EDA2CEE
MTSLQDDIGVPAGGDRMLINGELQTTGTAAKFDVPPRRRAGRWPSDQTIRRDVRRRLDCACATATRTPTANDMMDGKGYFVVIRTCGRTKQSRLAYRDGEKGYRGCLEAKTIGMPE